LNYIKLLIFEYKNVELWYLVMKYVFFGVFLVNYLRIFNSDIIKLKNFLLTWFFDCYYVKLTYIIDDG